MKRLVTCVALLVTAACTKETTVYQTPTTTSDNTVAANNDYSTPALSPQDEFLSAVHGENTMTWSMPDDVLLSTGYATCDALEAGATGMDVARTISETVGFDEEAGDVLVAIAAMATVYLCPEHGNVWDS